MSGGSFSRFLFRFLSHAGYRLSRSKTPAAIASMACIIPMDGIGMLTTCVRPVTMSQMASNSIPKFLFPIILIPPSNIDIVPLWLDFYAFYL